MFIVVYTLESRRANVKSETGHNNKKRQARITRTTLKYIDASRTKEMCFQYEKKKNRSKTIKKQEENFVRI